MMTIEEIRTMIEQLKREREAYQSQANFQLGVFAGRIAQLEEMEKRATMPAAESPPAA